VYADCRLSVQREFARSSDVVQRPSATLAPPSSTLHQTTARRISPTHRLYTHMTPAFNAMFCYSAADREAEYCDERVCLCLSVRDHIFGTAVRCSPQFLGLLAMAVAQSSCGGVVICYVLPV